MRVRTRIRQVARSQGRTVAEVACRLGLYRSNLSAMDAGRRSVSLRLLGRVARLLGCSPADLLEGSGSPQRPVFRHPALNRAVETRDQRLIDGRECGWVHTALLAWQRHYGARS